MADVERRLAELESNGLYRSLRSVEGAQGPRIKLDGRDVLLLCSNNYLGLAEHPRVRAAAAAAAEKFGAGAGAARLVSGNMEIHSELERNLAKFKGYDSCLLFGSGYLANIGVISALASEGEVVLSDELNHASIIDGCRLAKAETVVYRHRDMADLKRHLENASGRASVIVTDSVFSMDGDIAPLPEISQLAREHSCRVVVDEAHATGALGPGGRGAVAAAGLEDQIDVLVGTLGKSLGSYGAYVCCSAQTREYLINSARSFIFATAPPPPSLAAANEALEVLKEHPELVVKLQSNSEVLRTALSEAGVAVESETQIFPIIIGSAEQATAICSQLLDMGIYAQAIRPPTVPEGTSRLRITVMATHSPDDLAQAAATVATVTRTVA